MTLTNLEEKHLCLVIFLPATIVEGERTLEKENKFESIKILRNFLGSNPNFIKSFGEAFREIIF